MKDAARDRLILDARAANQLEPGLNSYTQTMGAVNAVLDITLRPGELLAAAGEDLRDFYYYYVISTSRARRNSLAFEMSFDEAKKFKAFEHCTLSPGSRCVVPALRTMAMGDLNSVEFGQQSHFLLASMLGIRLEDLITLRGRFPRQDWAVGIVIDDFIVLEKLTRADLPTALSTTIADAMVDAYETVGLEPNEKKRFRCELQSKFWGISVEGEEGLVRPQLERTLPVCFISASLARLGSATRKLRQVRGLQSFNAGEGLCA